MVESSFVTRLPRLLAPSSQHQHRTDDDQHQHKKDGDQHQQKPSQDENDYRNTFKYEKNVCALSWWEPIKLLEEGSISDIHLVR